MNQTDPESARQLLYRHGLPEDVIDGALCLHAQELAALQRLRMDELDLTGQKARIVGRIVDLIDPTKTPAAVSVVVSPPPNRADLRDRIAEALMRWAEGNNSSQYASMRRPETVRQNAYGRADAVLAVLPESGRAATLLDAAAMLDQRTSGIDAFASSDYGPEAQAVRELADAANELRRLAAEAPQEPTDEDVVEAHRLSLSFALGLGSGAPWDAIRDRTAELAGAEAPQPDTETRPTLRERHRAAWNALTPAEQDARIAALDAVDTAEPTSAVSQPAAADTDTEATCNSGPGWYEVINPRNATTCIALVHEDGSLYLPEGDDLTVDEFAFAAARGNAHRLVRADEVQQPAAADTEETHSDDVDPVYDPRAWETYRRDAGCGCTAPAPVDCKIPHGTGAWLCPCHRLSGPRWRDSDPRGTFLRSEEEAIRRHFTHPNRCTSTDGIFHCERPTGHPGGHRMGRTFWGRRPEDDA